MHGLLDDMERTKQTHITSWSSSSSSSFHIHDQNLLVTKVLPIYFPKQKYDFHTFRLQLTDWGFDDTTSNTAKNDHTVSFFHPCFQKGNASMCRFMRCGRQEKQQQYGQQEKALPTTTNGGGGGDNAAIHHNIHQVW
jgi:hypothetical protein